MLRQSACLSWFCFSVFKSPVSLNIRICDTYPVLKWIAMIAVSIPLTYSGMRLTVSSSLVIKVITMITVTAVNFLIVSFLFNKTILTFGYNKLKGIFRNV